MSQSASSARVDHLERSARLLLLRCPTVSAFLGAELQHLRAASAQPARDSGSSTATKPELLCKFCGIVQVAGLTCRVRVKTQDFGHHGLSSSSGIRRDSIQRKQARSSQQPRLRREKTVEYNCLHCSRSTAYQVSPSASYQARRQTETQTKAQSHAATPDILPPTPTSSYTSQHPPGSALVKASDLSELDPAFPTRTNAAVADIHQRKKVPPPASTLSDSASASASASARARAKARKKGSLAALVAKQSSTRGGGIRSGVTDGGMNLMDFMQED